jgi:predicted GIY-YIG superfamily endonuclease
MLYFYVYILKCRDGSYYVGHTDDLEKRLVEHQLGLIPTCYTIKRLPVELVYIDTTSSRYEAIAFERQLKNWSRKKKEALISGNWHELKLLAKKNFKNNKDKK